MTGILDLVPSFEDNNQEDQNNFEVISASELAELEGETSEEEEEEEEEETTKNKPEPEEGAEGVYKTLIDKGYIQEDEEFDGTYSKIDSYFDGIKTSTRESLLNEVPSTGKEIVEFILNGGDTLKDEDVLNFVQKYNAANETVEVTEANAEEIVKENFKTLGFDDEMIEVNIELMRDKKLLESKAKEIVESQKPDLTKEIEEVRVQREQKEAREREFFSNLNTEIESSKFSSKRKTEVQNAIRKDLVTDVILKAIENPKTYLQLVNLALSFQEDKGFVVEEFVKQAATKEVKKLKENIVKDNFSNFKTSKTNAKQDKTSTFDKIQFVNP